MTVFELKLKNAAAALAIVILAVGCGGSGGGRSSEPTAPGGGNQPGPSNNPPTANAGSDQSVTVGQSVTLNGSGTDPDGDSLTFSWTIVQRPAGSSATVSGGSRATASFIADVQGTYVLRLTVSDGRGASATDSATITASPAPNRSPVANAGPDQSVIVGQSVSLNGSGSDPDGDPISFSWSFAQRPAGSNATLTDANSAMASFIPDLAGTYVVDLRVSDSRGGTATDGTIITATPIPNQVPTADAGPDQTVSVGQSVTLNGAGNDPDGDPISFSWSFVQRPAGSLATFADPSSANTSFVPDVAGTYVVELRVSDDQGGVATDRAMISAQSAGGGNTVTIQLLASLRFSPSEVRISAGTRVRWINTATIFHTVTPDGHSEFSRATFNNNGDTFEHTFNTPGTFNYFCEPHRIVGMTGRVIVE